MRACLLGYRRLNPDEGVRKVMSELGARMPSSIDTLEVDIRNLKCLRIAKEFRPDIIHAVIGPSSPISALLLRVWALAL